MPRLEALATATPDHEIDQQQVRQVAADVVADAAPELTRLVRVFDNAGVKRRSLARPIAFYLDDPGWPERMRAFEEAGGDLAERVAERALARAGVPAEGVDAVVFVTTTGVATPSLEAHLADRIGLPRDVHRVPVWGLGCAGGVAGLARGADLARASADDRVLVVALELCSLAFLEDDVSKKNLVATALFGDGCAGALVAGDEIEAEGPSIDAAASHRWPDTEDVMGWDVLDEGLRVVFSPEIPEIVTRRLRPVVDRFCKRAGVGLDEARAILHPGGPRVLSAYEEALDLAPGDLAASRTVLREHGNMSSPTVLFALEESLSSEPLAPGEPALTGAVGPGFAAELAMLVGS